MRRLGWMAAGVATVGIAMLALAGGGGAQTATAPKARYWIDAATTSGFGAGANPMAMLTGRGGGAQHNLWLRIGSTLAPTGGAPKADHFVPPALRLGASVPLESPIRQSGVSGPTEIPRPRGRLRIFWGCGDRIGSGQPVVIDFARIAAGQYPPNFWSVNVPVETGPTAGNSRTYGHWPNDLQRDRKSLGAGASLIGQHRIAGSYTPEISFALAQDFLPPIALRTANAAAGGVTLTWQPVAGATGYYAMGIGGAGSERDGADLVWWASSTTREFGGGLADYLAPATVARLIGQKVVMPPTQTNCTIPAEVKAAAGEMLITTMTAFGPEANFAYPPRPADPRAAWRPEWTAKVRFKSTTTAMAGLDMDAMMGGRSEDGDRPAKPRNCKKKGLGGMLGKALGVPTDC